MGGAHDLYCCYSDKNLHKNIIIFDNPQQERMLELKSEIKVNTGNFSTVSGACNCQELQVPGGQGGEKRKHWG